VDAEVNTALNMCGPLLNVEVVVDAAPLMTVTALPMLPMLASLNCTVPTLRSQDLVFRSLTCTAPAVA
jgi:hypothetical protein